jgi:hypothetical protein
MHLREAPSREREISQWRRYARHGWKSNAGAAGQKGAGSR